MTLIIDSQRALFKRKYEGLKQKYFTALQGEFCLLCQDEDVWSWLY